jgi:hypothetical protein
MNPVNSDFTHCFRHAQLYRLGERCPKCELDEIRVKAAMESMRAFNQRIIDQGQGRG